MLLGISILQAQSSACCFWLEHKHSTQIRQRIAVQGQSWSPPRAPLFSKYIRFSAYSRAKIKAASSKSPYDTLGVPASATESDIKRAYRKLALRWHPDVNRATDAEQKFMSIKNAYQILVDPVLRSKYDSRRVPIHFNPFDLEEGETEDDIGDFWRDLQVSFDEFLNDVQEDINRRIISSGRPGSLWEELADIGEEFMDFLEDLGIIDEMYKTFDGKESTDRFYYGQEKDALEKEIDELEEMLVKLKRELGL